MGVSADTLRRWVDGGRLTAERDEQGRRIIPGPALAAFARELNRGTDREGLAISSARNRFMGIVTEVILGDVSAQVEIQAGPFRVVSMISRESAEELKLEPGVPAVGVVKSTNVVVERP
jgi:molybdopterin-binding protein